MTVEEHLKQIIGDLTVRVAQLLAEIDTLKTHAVTEKKKN